MDSVNDRNLRVKEHLCSGNEYLMPFTKKRRLSSLGPPPQGNCVLPSTPPHLRCDTADAEIKGPLVGAQDYERFPLSKPGLLPI